jgi:hypothetical protein
MEVLMSQPPLCLIIKLFLKEQPIILEFEILLNQSKLDIQELNKHSQIQV